MRKEELQALEKNVRDARDRSKEAQQDEKGLYETTKEREASFHKGAFKDALKYGKLSLAERADWRRAFDEYCVALDFDAQGELPLPEPVAKPAASRPKQVDTDFGIGGDAEVSGSYKVVN